MEIQSKTREIRGNLRKISPNFFFIAHYVQAKKHNKRDFLPDIKSVLTRFLVFGVKIKAVHEKTAYAGLKWRYKRMSA